MTNGTEKQIAWAEKIRTAWLKDFTSESKSSVRFFHASKLDTTEQWEACFAQILPLVRDWAMSQEDAIFWIDNQNGISAKAIDALRPEVKRMSAEIA